MKYDFAVFIGRFQPYHRGHQAVIDEALRIADKVIVLIGSANSPRTPKNPFTFAERESMILNSYSDMDQARIIAVPLDDVRNNDQKWVQNAQKAVYDAILSNAEGNTKNVYLHGTDELSITLIGFSKDHTSYYLKLFPQWDSINVKQKHVLSATDIREGFFVENLPDDEWIEICKILPLGTRMFLAEFMANPEFKQILAEKRYYADYKKLWESAPYPVNFVTTDAVVIQSGHVLLVTRKSVPGKGLLAFPGGFLNPNELIVDGMVRELREETHLSDKIGEMPPAKIKSFIKTSKIFDHPERSMRGRVITNAFLLKLPDERELYAVRGDDDAEKAGWYELGSLRGEDFFEDHFTILNELLEDL